MLPPQWLGATSPRMRCLYGGVCVSAAAAKSSKRCYVGTSALLQFFVSDAAFAHASFFVKVDADTLVFPRRVAAWLAALLHGNSWAASKYHTAVMPHTPAGQPARPAGPPLFYSGHVASVTRPQGSHSAQSLTPCPVLRSL
jgi:hypothetical protein